MKFIQPGGTSRGVLMEKPTWILKMTDEKGVSGYGEVSIIEGLSIETVASVELQLKRISEEIERENDFSEYLVGFPAINFAFEQIFSDLKNQGRQLLFDNPFSRGEKGIAINGLIWMNPIERMKADVKEKIESSFHCVKFKIGALNFSDELKLLQEVRNEFGGNLEIRVDANGAFGETNVFDVMDELEKLNIHSIEQPVATGHFDLMSRVCKHNGVGVALDEELIGITENRENLIRTISPDYLILKPSLLGGFESCNDWISIAESNKIGWWATSALESNIGLNAIAQWVADKEIVLPQGLGTGSLFSNNIPSPLKIEDAELVMDNTLKWKMPF